MLSLTEMSIAARIYGTDYGKYVHLLRHGFVAMPEMDEIQRYIMRHKTVTPQVDRKNTPDEKWSDNND